MDSLSGEGHRGGGPEPQMVNDPEYDARRRIDRESDGTIILTARFGRNKRYILAFNRGNDEAAKAAVGKWIADEQAE